MELFKALKEKNFASIKDYCEEKIAEVLSNKIYGAKTSYLNKIRGIDEDTKIIIKSNDEDDHEKAKKSNKDGDDSDDRKEVKDTDDSEGDGEDNDSKKKKSFPFAKKAPVKEAKEPVDYNGEDENQDPDEDEPKVVVKKSKTKKEVKGVTGKDAANGKFADASS